MPDANPETPAWRLYPPAGEPGGEPGPGGLQAAARQVAPDPGVEPGPPAREAATWEILPAVEVSRVTESPDLVPPGYSRTDPLVIAPGMSSVTKEGVWTVPPYLRLQGGLGSIRLDCQLAQPAAPVIQVDVTGGVGSILIVVPQGWAANHDRLRGGTGSRRVTVLDQPLPDQPLLVLRGQLLLGSLEVRYPRRRDRRRARRQAWLAARQFR